MQVVSILYTVIPCLLLAIVFSSVVIFVCWRYHKQIIYQASQSAATPLVPVVGKPTYPKVSLLSRKRGSSGWRVVVMYVEFCGVFVLLVFPTITMKFAGAPLPEKYKRPHYISWDPRRPHGQCACLRVEWPGSSPGRGHCVVFLIKTLYSHSASLHPGV